jgi:pyridinium-3,5-bisthiocarboxylic acid mononucleotide nickel chelatase
MKTLYFDCFAGASGDMILGALVAAGVDADLLSRQLSLLNVQGYTIDFKTVSRAGLSATHAVVETQPERKHRHLAEILKIIDNSALSVAVKQRASQVFTRLAEAEARVHNEPIDRVHFHEVGALDAIVDVVGAAICFEMLRVERFVSSPIHVGSGFVEMEHGRFPVPPPAVAELLKGVPFYSTDIKGELLTPTGAAIITTVAEQYGSFPAIKATTVGYGAGTREYESFPNVLRVFVGDSESQEPNVQSLLMIETNIDDLSPQILGHVMDRAFELGALDCYFTSVQMKKNRPGILLSILCEQSQENQLMQLLFKETTTLGVRSYDVERRALERTVVRIETQYGPIDVKVARLDGQIVNEMPEFEQCRRIAKDAGIPLKEVEEAVRAAWRQQRGKDEELNPKP